MQPGLCKVCNRGTGLVGHVHHVLLFYMLICDQPSIGVPIHGHRPPSHLRMLSLYTQLMPTVSLVEAAPLSVVPLRPAGALSCLAPTGPTGSEGIAHRVRC